MCLVTLGTRIPDCVTRGDLLRRSVNRSRESILTSWQRPSSSLPSEPEGHGSPTRLLTAFRQEPGTKVAKFRGSCAAALSVNLSGSSMSRFPIEVGRFGSSVSVRASCGAKLAGPTE